MTLLELCEPLFQYVCLVHRSARFGGQQSYATARSRVKALLDEEIPNRALSEPGHLISQYEKVKLPLMFFVDSIFSESQLPFAKQWDRTRLAYEINEMAGDDKFFEMLEATLQDMTPEAAERLTIFYTCLGLGFCGCLVKMEDQIKQLMQRIHGRVQGMVGDELPGRMCPEAYRHVDTRNLVVPPSRALFAIGLALVTLLVVLFIGNIVLFRMESGELVQHLQAVQSKRGPEQPAPVAAPKPPKPAADAPADAAAGGAS